MSVIEVIIYFFLDTELSCDIKSKSNMKIRGKTWPLTLPSDDVNFKIDMYLYGKMALLRLTHWYIIFL